MKYLKSIFEKDTFENDYIKFYKNNIEPQLLDNDCEFAYINDYMLDLIDFLSDHDYNHNAWLMLGRHTIFFSSDFE